MKKIYLILICVASLFSASYAFNEANIQKAYGTYLAKLRTCSPYTYNVDGDAGISQIVGMYNRKCVIRAYTYIAGAECSLKNSELRNYIKLLPKTNEYISLLNNHRAVSTTSTSFVIMDVMSNSSDSCGLLSINANISFEGKFSMQGDAKFDH